MDVSISVKEIKDDSFLSDYEKENAVECVGRAVDIPLIELYKKQDNFVKPGRKNDVKALIFKIEIDKGENNISTINMIMNTFFVDEFGEKNLLSLKSEDIQKKFYYQALCYPLDRRILNSDKWEKNEEINQDFRLRFYKKIQESLNAEIEQTNEEELKNQIKEVKSIAQINLIQDMEIPEEDIQDDEELIYDAKGLSKQINTELPISKFNEIFYATLKYFTIGSEKTMYVRSQRGEISAESFLTAVADFVQRNYPDVKENDAKILLDKMVTAIYGNYVLEELLNDDSISDIKVIAPNKIRVKVGGKRLTSNLHFIDEDDYNRFIEGIALRRGLSLKDSAVHVFTDKNTNSKYIMRFNICTPHINSVNYPYLHIRKVRKSKYEMEDLIRFQMMDKKTADYLINKAKNGKGIVFTGKGASGKTTIMNVLLDKIPKGKSGLIIQESEELFSNTHPDFMFQHVTPYYTLKELAKNGLLTDLDYFIIGEIKGEEAMYFLNAAATGHRCWCSVHSASSKDAIGKLADYVMYESKYNLEQATYMLKELDTIVFMKDFKVEEISEIAGWDNEKKELVYHTVFKR